MMATASSIAAFSGRSALTEITRGGLTPQSLADLHEAGAASSSHSPAGDELDYDSRATMPRMLAVCTLFIFPIAACGGAKPVAKGVAASSASAGSNAAPAPPSKATGFLSSTVPMSEMPPPFDFGSKKAANNVYHTSNTAALSCVTTAPANASPPTDVAAIGRSCADPTKLHPLGAVSSGTQKPDAVAQRFPFAAQAGHCYRAYGSAAPSVTDFSVFILDSTGATAARGHADGARVATPPDGALCFHDADAANVVVTIGRGSGPFAVQLWSDQ
jgi:hypothetical protein